VTVDLILELCYDFILKHAGSWHVLLIFWRRAEQISCRHSRRFPSTTGNSKKFILLCPIATNHPAALKANGIVTKIEPPWRVPMQWHHSALPEKDKCRILQVWSAAQFYNVELKAERNMGQIGRSNITTGLNGLYPPEQHYRYKTNIRKAVVWTWASEGFFPGEWALMDSLQNFLRGAKSGAICFFPLETKETTFLLQISKSRRPWPPCPPLPTPINNCQQQNMKRVVCFHKFEVKKTQLNSKYFVVNYKELRKNNRQTMLYVGMFFVMCVFFC